MKLPENLCYFYTQCLPVCTAWHFACTKDTLQIRCTMKILGRASLAELVLAFQHSRAVCVHGCCRQPALRAATQAPLPIQLKAGAGLMDYTMPTTPTSRGALQPHPSLWTSLRKHLDFRELLHANPERCGTHLHLQTESCALGVVSRVRNQHAFQLLQRPLRKQKKK